MATKKTPVDKSTVPAVGAQLWFYDDNHNIYKKDETGKRVKDLRAQWRPAYVLAETPVSLVFGHFQDTNVNPDHRNAWKVPKKEFYDGKAPSRFARTEEEVEARMWLEGARYHLADWVRGVKSPSVLAQVALLTGYDFKYDESPLPPALRKKAVESLTYPPSSDMRDFVRVLAELRAVGLTPEQTKGLRDSMNCTTDYICDVLARAEEEFESIKEEFESIKEGFK